MRRRRNTSRHLRNLGRKGWSRKMSKEERKRRLEEVAEGVGGIPKLKFEVTLSRKSLKELREFLEGEDIDTSDMDEEDLVRELFFQQSAHPGNEWDFRDEVGIQKV